MLSLALIIFVFSFPDVGEAAGQRAAWGQQKWTGA